MGLDASFEIVLPGEHPLPDPLDVWETVSTGESFAADAALPDDTVTWHVNLPADSQVASAIMARQLDQVAVVHRALPEAARRFDVMLHAAQAHDADSYAADDPALPVPEQSLAAFLQRATGPESFGPGDWLRSRWLAPTEDLQSFFDRITQALTAFAQVETAIDQHVIGITRVSWGGDVQTVWASFADHMAMARHQESLTLTLASRMTWIRIAGQAVQGALQIAALVTGPGTAITALPAVWKFIKEVVAETKQLRSEG